MKIIVINGPNINLLGIREKDIYGSMTYEGLLELIYRESRSMGIDVDVFQSNSEGDLIDKIQDARNIYDGIIINPGGYSHYSIAIHDALKGINIPSIEVHISNIYAREDFRQVSVTAKACEAQISGMGVYGYILAIYGIKNMLKNR